MDQVMNEHARDEERLGRITAAFKDGIVLVDGSGTIVWMDRAARRRVNGELRNLNLPLTKSDADSVECFISPVDITVNGEHLTLGVIQEAETPKQRPDLVAAIDSVLADSASWFTRTMEKLKTVSQSKAGGATTATGNGTTQLDSLSARERQVLGLICEGQSDVQMAKLLGLSENTVRNHIAALYRKIGVNRRTAAVIWARERGITGCDGLDLGRRVGRTGNGHGNGRTLSY
jgi:DNA-binding CsgD family transcriptional regulator